MDHQAVIMEFAYPAAMHDGGFSCWPMVVGCVRSEGETPGLPFVIWRLKPLHSLVHKKINKFPIMGWKSRPTCFLNSHEADYQVLETPIMNQPEKHWWIPCLPRLEQMPEVHQGPWAHLWGWGSLSPFKVYTYALLFGIPLWSLCLLPLLTFLRTQLWDH